MKTRKYYSSNVDKGGLEVEHSQIPAIFRHRIQPCAGGQMRKAGVRHRAPRRL